MKERKISNMNIFKFEFKRQFKSLMIWTIVCSALVVLFMALFPSMKEMGMQDLVGDKLDALPPAMLEAFNISGMMDFSNIKDFMGYCLQYIVMASGIYGIILGVAALSKEEKDGTIEFLYSKPVTRSKIVTSKLSASALIMFIFIIIVGAVTMVAGIMVKPEELKTIDLLIDIKVIYIGMALLSYTFMALGFMLSILIRARANVTAISLGIFFASFFIGVVGKLKESLDWLIYLSPTDYFIPAKVLNDGFEVKYIVIALVIMLVSIAGTYIIYNKKDLG